jgi:hypothetical protein
MLRTCGLEQEVFDESDVNEPTSKGGSQSVVNFSK